MAFALVAHTSVRSTNQNGVTTSAIDTTGADFIVCVVSDYQGTALGTVTDNKGTNIYSHLVSQSHSLDDRCTIWYCINPAVGTGHTFSYGGTASFPSLFVSAWSGSKLTSTIDVQNGAVFGVGTSAQPGSITPTVANSLVVTGITNQDAVTNLATTNATLLESQQTVSAVAYGGGLAYAIQTAAAAVNPTWTWTTGADSSVVIASFKPAVAGAFLSRLSLLGAG